MKTINFSIEDELADRLLERARSQGNRSISSLIREACAEKLDRDTVAEPQPEPQEGEQ